MNLYIRLHGQKEVVEFLEIINPEFKGKKLKSGQYHVMINQENINNYAHLYEKDGFKFLRIVPHIELMPDYVEMLDFTEWKLMRAME